MKKILLVLVIVFGVLSLFAQYGNNNKFSLGVGLGIPYGVLGFNADYNITNHFTATAGFGTALTGTGYSIGARAYLRGPGKHWRPRLTAVYGVNGIISGDVYTSSGGSSQVESIKETYTGTNLGIGQLWQWGNRKQHGIDLDLIIILDSGLTDRVDELNEDPRNDVSEPGMVKLSFGYRYQF